MTAAEGKAAYALDSLYNRIYEMKEVLNQVDSRSNYLLTYLCRGGRKMDDFIQFFFQRRLFRFNNFDLLSKEHVSVYIILKWRFIDQLYRTNILFWAVQQKDDTDYYHNLMNVHGGAGSFYFNPEDLNQKDFNQKSVLEYAIERHNRFRNFASDVWTEKIIQMIEKLKSRGEVILLFKF